MRRLLMHVNSSEKAEALSADYGLSARLGRQLDENSFDMSLHGFRSDAKRSSDLLVGLTAGDELNDRLLPV